MVEALYSAYFHEGRDIGDRAVLLAIAGACGLDVASVDAALHSDAGADAIIEQAQWAQTIGVSGVPLFVFGEKYALSGAQPPNALLMAMRKTAQEQNA